MIIANWKLNPSTLAEAIKLLGGYKEGNGKVIVCPPAVFLPPLIKIFGRSFLWGAQDFSVYTSGAYTGELSAAMLADSGASHVIIGHSERREYFGESDEKIGQKVKTALHSNLSPILCVGGGLQARDRGSNIQKIVLRQLSSALEKIDSQLLRRHPVVIAYEPVWAIGTGKTPSSVHIREIVAKMRSYVAKKYGKISAGQIPIIYGGSVTGKNINLIALSGVNGLLVGGASLKAAEFNKVVKNFQLA